MTGVDCASDGEKASPVWLWLALYFCHVSFVTVPRDCIHRITTTIGSRTQVYLVQWTSIQDGSALRLTFAPSWPGRLLHIIEYGPKQLVRKRLGLIHVAACSENTRLHSDSRFTYISDQCYTRQSNSIITKYISTRRRWQRFDISS